MNYSRLSDSSDTILVAQSIKFFRPNNARTRYPTEEEERLRQVFPPKHWSKVEVAINTGMRRDEQFSLQWANVNFHTKVAPISRSTHEESRHIYMNRLRRRHSAESPEPYEEPIGNRERDWKDGAQCQ